ncbi:MAG: hypothetical protein JW743_06540 [Deltaproteobacteria bacterium]|jgi:hypothetical protein|nr:hypothetical protein [Deltaproteobacteria bacterium]MBN2846116.1 hypothetical protein [Deltaproteobacteria bacterium]
MGEILRNKSTIMSRQCRICGKAEGQDDDLLLSDLEDMIDLTEEEEAAWEWYAEKIGERTLSDVLNFRGSYTREDLVHTFVLSNLVERILEIETLCESCYVRNTEGRARN